MMNVIITIGAVIAGVLINSATLMVLWGWFIADLLGALELKVAVGVVLITAYLTHQDDDKPELSYKHKIIEDLLEGLFKSIIYLVTGGIFYWALLR